MNEAFIDGFELTERYGKKANNPYVKNSDEWEDWEDGKAAALKAHKGTKK